MTHRNHSALIVEDDDFAASVLRLQLVQIGFKRVTIATSGACARARLERDGPYELVSCDLQLPDIGVYELLDMVQALQPGAAIALVSSASESLLEAVKARARADGVNVLGVLHKPASPQRLALIAQHLG